MAQGAKKGTLRKLFFSMLYISAFTFGGGFVIITFMKRKFVDELGWIDEQEMLDLTALAQSSPGAIAVNAAILVGWRVGGFLGMVTAVLGTVLPPITILSIISLFYAAFAANPYVAVGLEGLLAGVAAVSLEVVWGLGTNVVKTKSAIHMVVMAVAFVATLVYGVNVIYIILAAGLLGVVLAMVQRKKGGELQ